MVDALRPGSRLGSYRIEELIARGGMAAVYRAEHVHLRRPVALKIPTAALAEQDVFRERFIRESQAVAGMQHPNLITVYDAGEIDGVLFLAMQFVDGTDLARVLEREGAQSPERTLEIVAQVAGALDLAHARGVVHRDVKPANILVEGTWCLLADFGLTKLEDATAARTATGTVLGSLPYSAPEQLEGGDVDRRVDVYALGCVAYECLTGERPFPRATNAAVMYAHLTEAPPRPSRLRPGLPAAVDGVIARAMAKAPEERFRACGDLAAALRAALATPAGQGGRAAPAEPPPEPTQTPLPGLLARSRGKPLVGRAAELAALLELIERPRQPGHSIACLIGEPGIGKTHLAAHAVARAHAAGATVLYGRSEEDAVIPYEPFVEALRHYCTHVDVSELGRELGMQAQVLAPLIPELLPLASARASSELAHERYRLFEAVVALLEHAGAGRPLLFVFEDLHFADKETLLLLRHVLRSYSGQRLVAILTYRELDLEADHPLRDLLDDIGREQELLAIELAGLSEEQAAELAAGRSGNPLPRTYVRFLLEQTSGNPFFIEELVRSAADTGSLQLSGSAVGDTVTAVPPSVRRMLQRRLERVSRATREVLAVAALLGRDFRLAVLGVVTNARGDELLDAVEEAIAVGILTEQPGAADQFAFTHPLVREVLLAHTTDVRRRRLHARIAEGLERRREQLGIEPAELAVHFFEARQLGLGDRALAYSVEAGRRAAAMYANEPACRYFTQALCVLDEGLADDESLRPEILLDLGSAMWRASRPGVHEVFHRAVDLSRRAHAAEPMARAALGLGGRFYAPGVADTAYLDLLQEALAGLPEDDSALRVRLLSRLAETLTTHAREAEALEAGGEALAIATRLGDDQALLAALGGRHAALLDIDHAAERGAIAGRLVESADRQGDLEAAALARHWLLFDLFESGALDTASGVLAELEGLERRLQQPLYRHSVLAWRGVWALLRSHVDEAEALARQSLQLAERAGARDAPAHFAAQMLMIRREEGGEASVLASVREASARSFWFDGLGPALAALELAAGEEAVARRLVRSLAHDGFAAVPRGPFRLTSLAWLAEAAAGLGDQDACTTLYGLLLPSADAFVQAGFTGCLGSVHLYLGRLAAVTGTADGGGQHLTLALDRHRAIAAPGLVARTVEAMPAQLRRELDVDQLVT